MTAEAEDLEQPDAARAGVFVYTESVGEDKSVVKFKLEGGIDPLAVPTLLAMAAKVANLNLGIGA